MQNKGIWRAVGGPNLDGLLPLESSGGERLAVDVRGGIAWPWPVAVGTRLVSAGAAVVVGYAPADGRARLLAWRLMGTVGPAYAPDGWVEDGGVAGALREGAMGLGCWRWYAVCNPADQAESLRTVRRVLPDLPGLRVTALEDQTAPADVRALLWRWASERRLVPMPEDALAEIEREEQEPAGPMPLAAAVAAALESLERRPWRAAQRKGWEPVPREIVMGAGGG